MQIPLAGVPTRKVDMLDFVVVGGGIAGLASAWSLRLAGHRVTVLEQHHPDVLSKVTLLLSAHLSLTLDTSVVSALFLPQT